MKFGKEGGDKSEVKGGWGIRELVVYFTNYGFDKEEERN